jgi:bacteriocin biosynthesis cyclodehydratase domain-containing protein
LVNVAELLDTALPEFPRLASWVVRVDHENDGLVLRTHDRFYVIQEPLFSAVYDALGAELDGSRPVGEILDALPDGVLPTSGVALLKILRSWGLLFDEAHGQDEVPSGVQREIEDFLGQYTLQPREAWARLAGSGVLVFGDHGAARAARASLLDLGIDATTVLGDGPDSLAQLRAELTGNSVQLLVAVDPPDSAAVNSLCLELSVPCLYAENFGREALLGPLVLPGESACFACLQARRAAHLALPAGVQLAPSAAADLATAGRTARSDALAAVLYAQLSLEAGRFVSGFAPAATIGGCFWLTASTPATERHAVLRVPSCPACSQFRGAESREGAYGVPQGHA